MTEKKLNLFLLSLQAVTKSNPFNKKTEVFKVGGKIFAIYQVKDNIINLNFKADPQDNLGYRDIFESITPGYHMNKKHWSTIKIDGEVKDPFLKDILKESYDIVFKSLTKVIKKEIMKNQPNPEFPLPLNSDPI